MTRRLAADVAANLLPHVPLARQAEGVQLVVRRSEAEVAVAGAQKSVPSEIAAPERHEPPLAKLHSSAPVAALSAYMYPSGSSEQPYTTPLAVVTGPEVPPP